MFKNESGFSLVELAVAAGLAVALGAVAVASLSSASTDIVANGDAGKVAADAANDSAIADGTNAAAL